MQALLQLCTCSLILLGLHHFPLSPRSPLLSLLPFAAHLSTALAQPAMSDFKQLPHKLLLIPGPVEADDKGATC